MLFLYSTLLLLLIPVFILVNKKKLKLQDPSLSHRRFAERFGWTPAHFKKHGIHIHCVSVGELNAASGLIRNLMSEYPKLPITLTTSSLTGAIHAYNLFKDKVQHAYLPIDFPWFMRRFFKAIAPKLSLITEVEIWPNMVAQCDKQNIPVCLINARMTTKSLTSYRKVSWLFRPTLRKMQAICVQSSESFENFLSYGVIKKHLTLSQNMKFDLQAEAHDEILGALIISQYHLKGRCILLAASTHDPEEKMLLSAYKFLKQEYADLVLMVVPRHPHRFEEVYQIITASGYKTERISHSKVFTDLQVIEAAQTKPTKISDAITHTKNVDCIVVDAMGWLKACYSICDVAFIGGSFATKGGHNALEAALYSKPIVMGPSLFNNPSICQHLQEQNALVVAQDQAQLQNAIRYCLQNPELARSNGEKGSNVLQKNSGAIANTMTVLRQFL